MGGAQVEADWSEMGLLLLLLMEFWIRIVGLPRGIPTGVVCPPIRLEDTLFDFDAVDTTKMAIPLCGQAPPPWRFVGQGPGHGGCGSSVHRALARAGGGRSNRSVVVHPLD